MLVVSEKAGAEIKKAVGSETAEAKYLILYFMGSGCSGPAIGLTLQESADGLEKLESNGVTAYIDPRLNEFLGNIGDIKVDFVEEGDRSGFTIKVGEGNCGNCNCS